MIMYNVVEVEQFILEYQKTTRCFIIMKALEYNIKITTADKKKDVS